MLKYLTINGQKKIQEELAYLTKSKRFEISEKLKFATDLRDLRENSEYDAACEYYLLMENRIYELEKILNESVIYQRKNDGRIEIGSKVDLKIDDEIERYEIVGYGETDIHNNKILYTSPLAEALLKKTVNDIVTVSNEYTTYDAQIISIE